MKALKLFTLVCALALLVTSCGSSLQLSNSAAGDDIYYNPDASKSLASVKDGRHVDLDPQTKQLIEETNEVAENPSYEAEGDTVVRTEPYEIADTYEKAAFNRELALKDPSYGFTTSSTYSDAFSVSMRYSPYSYKVFAVGNTVWAEPYYISSMFGFPYWSPYVNYNYYYSPFRSYYSYYPYYSWRNYYGWGYDPWYCGGYWNDPWYGYWNDPWYGYSSWGGPWYGGGYGHYYPHYGGGHYYGSSSGYAYGPRKTLRDNRNSSGSYSSSRNSSSITTSSARRESLNSRRPQNSTESVRNNSVRNESVSSRRSGVTSSTNLSRRPSSVGTGSATRGGAVSSRRTSSYTPTYSRPVRSSQSTVFNEGTSDYSSTSNGRRPSSVSGSSTYRSSDTPSRRSESVATPVRRSSSSSEYTPRRSSSSSSYSSSPSRSSSSSSSSYSSPSRSSSSGSSSHSSGSSSSGSSRGRR